MDDEIDVYLDTHPEVYPDAENLETRIRTWWPRRHENTISWTKAYVRAALRADVARLRKYRANPPVPHSVL